MKITTKVNTIYDENRHEKITNICWSEENVTSVITDIFNKTLETFDPSLFWPTDPAEDAENNSNKSIYFGASGTLWALDQIAQFLKKDLPFNKAELITKIYDSYLLSPDTSTVVPSFFLGEVGILLVHYKFNPTQTVEDRLYQTIKENIENPTLEALWGAPGTMLGASFMFEQTRDKKWSDLYLDNVNFMLQTWKENKEKGYFIWTQDLYGKIRNLIGAGHGFFGNIFPLLKNLELMNNEDQEFVIAKTLETTRKLAVEENGLINWPVADEVPNERWLVQWCHGSPGVITSLGSFPKNIDLEFEVMLLKAGELIWLAGPLNKGVALCHGTDGNGFAFLKLYKRTGEKIWLDRARQFAMHSLSQRNGRHTLFTGELGLAVYLINCVNGTDQFPILDNI
jgi:lantibiotic modifying enzyme